MTKPIFQQKTIKWTQNSVALTYLALCVVCSLVLIVKWPGYYEDNQKLNSIYEHLSYVVYSTWIFFYAIVVWAATLLSVYSIWSIFKGIKSLEDSSGLIEVNLRQLVIHAFILILLCVGVSLYTLHYYQVFEGIHNYAVLVIQLMTCII